MQVLQQFSLKYQLNKCNQLYTISDYEGKDLFYFIRLVHIKMQWK